MTFPLLKVPQLVLAEIIDSLNPNDLFTFSLCSRRAYNIGKKLRKRSLDWEIWVCCGFNKETCVDFNKTAKPFTLLCVRHVSEVSRPLEDLEKVNINGRQVPCAIGISFGSLMTFWEDLTLGLREIVAYTFEFLGINKITALAIGRQEMWIIDWVISRQMIIEEVIMDKREELTSEEYANVLRTCKNIDSLSLYTTPPDNFQYSESFKQTKLLIFIPGFWITIDNLMAMNAMSIFIDGSNLTCSNINRYLKNWLSGAHSQLKLLQVEMKRIIFQEIFDGIEDRLTFVRNERLYAWIENEKKSIAPAYDMERTDGSTASITWRALPNGVTGEFSVFVWPDFNNEANPEKIEKE